MGLNLDYLVVDSTRYLFVLLFLHHILKQMMHNDAIRALPYASDCVDSFRNPSGEIWSLFASTRRNEGSFPTLTAESFFALVLPWKRYMQTFPIDFECDPEALIKVCKGIHRGLVDEFRCALVWGRSTKYNPQRVGLGHVLDDEDVIQVIKKKA